MRRLRRTLEQSVRELDPRRDRVAHHPVDVAAVDDVLGVAVVGAERDPARAVLGDEREERLEVRAIDASLTSSHIPAHGLAALLHRRRLVVERIPAAT